MHITNATEFDDTSKAELQNLIDSNKRPRVEVAYEATDCDSYIIKEIELEELD